MRRFCFGLLAPLVLPLCHGREAGPHTLWYDQPAGQWVEALPVGNGTLAAMVFGHPGEERLQLNEGTLWAGGPYDPVNPAAKAAIPRVRQLVNEGKFREAAALVDADVTWQDGALEEAVLRSPRGGRVRLIHGTVTRDITLAAGEPLRWDGK